MLFFKAITVLEVVMPTVDALALLAHANIAQLAYVVTYLASNRSEPFFP